MLEKKYKIFGWVFVTPIVFLILIFIAYPLIESLKLSFFRWDGLTQEKFIGLQNYIKLFTKDTVFWISVKNTFVFSAVTVSGIVGIGFLTALVLERRIKGWQFFKVVWFMPVILSQTVVGVLWLKFFDPSAGLVNQILRGVGLDFLTQNWLGNPKLTLFSVAAVTIWHYSGYAMLFFLVAMEDIPVEVNEAATIDGVTPSERVRYITFPLIRPVFAIVVMLMLIGGLKTFDSIFVLTQGGPGNSTMVLSILLYKSAFFYYDFGYASMIATIMFVLLFLVSMFYQRLFLRFE